MANSRAEPTHAIGKVVWIEDGRIGQPYGRRQFRTSEGEPQLDWRRASGRRLRNRGRSQQRKHPGHDRPQTDQHHQQLEKLRQPPFGSELIDDPEQDRANDDGNQDANCECEHDGLPPILAAVFSSLPSAPSVDELKNDQKQNGADGGGGNGRRDVGPKVDNRESRAQIPNITDASTPAMRLR